MLITSILCVTSLAQVQPAGIDAAEFTRRVKAEHGRIHELAVVYQGQLDWVGPPAELQRPVEDFADRYEGAYLLRSDGAEGVDLYRNSPGDRDRIERVQRLFSGRMMRSALVIDDRTLSEAGERPGEPTEMGGPQSIHPLVPISLFRIIGAFAGWGYVDEGFEEIDGRRCLRVRVAMGYGPSDSSWFTHWVDLERGMLPIRSEQFSQGKLVARIDRVELKQYALPDQSTVWLPVRCRLQGFLWGDKHHEQPVMTGSVSIVPESVQLNRELPDDLFRLGPTPRTPVTDALAPFIASLPLRQAYLRQMKETANAPKP